MRGYAFRPRVAGLKEFALQRDRLIFGADSSQVSSNRMARSTAARTVEVSRTRFRITRNDVENLVVVPIDGIFYRVAKEVGDIHDLLRREGKSRHSFFGTALENDRADRLAILVIQNHNRTKQIRSFFPTFCGGPVAEAAMPHERLSAAIHGVLIELRRAPPSLTDGRRAGPEARRDCSQTGDACETRRCADWLRARTGAQTMRASATTARARIGMPAIVSRSRRKVAKP